jgi:hypothetical protein
MSGWWSRARDSIAPAGGPTPLGDIRPGLARLCRGWHRLAAVRPVWPRGRVNSREHRQPVPELFTVRAEPCGSGARSSLPRRGASPHADAQQPDLRSALLIPSDRRPPADARRSSPSGIEGSDPERVDLPSGAGHDAFIPARLAALTLSTCLTL